MSTLDEHSMYTGCTRTITALPGDMIGDTCVKAVAEAEKWGCPVSFNFNGVTVTATPGKTADALVAEYHAELDRKYEEYAASPEYKRREEEAARAREEQDKRRQALLSKAPASMSLKDEDGWKASVEANKDPYGACIATYAERWARLMEAGMADGKELEEVAEECSNLADEEGITGFMYGCAVSILSQVWTHGEELRRWHNRKYQLGSEGDAANESGGVLNPALMSLGSKE